MKKVLYSFFLFVLLSSSIYSQFDVWIQTTGTIGRVFALVIYQDNQDLMYAGGLDQGVNVSTDGGTTWTQANSGLLNNQVQALAISKTNPVGQLNLYAGTAPGANGGVYKSTNGGMNWTLVNNGITETNIGIQALLVHPDNPNIAWVCVFDGLADAVNGLYKTTDGGANWFPATNGIGSLKNFLSLAMSPADPNTLYLGSSFTFATTTGPSVIYKSTDGGVSWVLSSNGLPTDPAEINPVRTIQISSVNPNIIIAGLFMNTANGGFYVSTDAGANWTKKHNGLPPDVGTLIRSAAIRPLFEDQFYVGLDRSTGVNIGVWTTTDGGNNWVSMNGGSMLDTYTIRALVFNSTGTHTLFAGCSSTTGNGVYEYNFSFIPVELISFSAEVFNNNVTLSWITATELNNSGFEIQKKALSFGESATGGLGEAWEKIGFIAGYGTSTEIHNYSFSDYDLTPGKYFYRLKQIDFDGSYTYIDAIEVEVLNVDYYILLQNYPNPFNPTTTISYHIPRDGFVTLKIYDVLGNELRTLVNERKPAGRYEVKLDAGDSDGSGQVLASGIYIYRIQVNDYVSSKKMLMIK